MRPRAEELIINMGLRNVMHSDVVNSLLRNPLSYRMRRVGLDGQRLVRMPRERGILTVLG